MRPNLTISGHRADARSSNTVITAAVAAVLLAALAFLPGPVLFLGVLGGTVALAISLAELRRHGGPEVPHLPLVPEH